MSIIPGHVVANRRCSLRRVHRRRTSSPQGSLSNGFGLSRSTPWPNQCAPLFSHTQYSAATYTTISMGMLCNTRSTVIPLRLSTSVMQSCTRYECASPSNDSHSDLVLARQHVRLHQVNEGRFQLCGRFISQQLLNFSARKKRDETSTSRGPVPIERKLTALMFIALRQQHF